MNIKKFWRDLIWDTTSNKVGSKKFMSIVSFFSALVLVFGNSWFDFELSLPALGSLLTMAGFNSYLGQREKNVKTNQNMVMDYVKSNNKQSEKEYPLEMD